MKWEAFYTQIYFFEFNFHEFLKVSLYVKYAWWLTCVSLVKKIHSIVVGVFMQLTHGYGCPHPVSLLEVKSHFCFQSVLLLMHLAGSRWLFHIGDPFLAHRLGQARLCRHLGIRIVHRRSFSASPSLTLCHSALEINQTLSSRVSARQWG